MAFTFDFHEVRVCRGDSEVGLVIWKDVVASMVFRMTMQPSVVDICANSSGSCLGGSGNRISRILKLNVLTLEAATLSMSILSPKTMKGSETRASILAPNPYHRPKRRCNAIGPFSRTLVCLRMRQDRIKEFQVREEAQDSEKYCSVPQCPRETLATLPGRGGISEALQHETLIYVRTSTRRKHSFEATEIRFV